MQRRCQPGTARSKDQPFFNEAVPYEKRTLMPGSWHKTVCAEIFIIGGGKPLSTLEVFTKRAI